MAAFICGPSEAAAIPEEDDTQSFIKPLMPLAIIQQHLAKFWSLMINNRWLAGSTVLWKTGKLLEFYSTLCAWRKEVRT
jgi:hypothetical protein